MGTSVPLTGPVRAQLPPPCADCVFWQTPRGLTDRARKDRWVRAADRRARPFGRMLIGPAGERGMVQYGPVDIFPRARRLPAGPPSRGAGLITCVFLPDTDPLAACERLLLEALADLKSRDLPAAEAFALRDEDGPTRRHRVAGHHTLLDHDLLGSLGFAPLRRRGPVTLMRLELGGLAPAASLSERLAAPLRRATVAAPPAPA